MRDIIITLKNWENKRYEVYYDNDKTAYLLCETVEIADGFAYCKIYDKDEVIMLPTDRIDAIIVLKGEKRIWDKSEVM